MKESKEPKIEKELRLDQLIGGIVPNLIAFGLFLGAIGYFAATGKMAEMFGWGRACQSLFKKLEEDS